MPAFLLPLMLNRYTLGAVIALGLILGAYAKGYSTASAKCHDAELRAIIATQARDMAAWKVADDVERMLNGDLAKKAANLEELVRDYAKEVLLRPDGNCTLSDADVRSIQRLH